MVKVQHFGADSGGAGGGGNYEKNITHAGEQVAQYREDHPEEVRGMSEREQVKMALQNWESAGVQGQGEHDGGALVVTDPHSSQSVSDNGVVDDDMLPDYLKGENVAPEVVEQVRTLVDIATRVDIKRAINDLKEDPFCGIRISKR